jgi:hypothetical protein
MVQLPRFLTCSKLIIGSGGQENAHYKATNQKDQVDVSATNFLEVLCELSWVLLQDAAVLQDAHPELQFFKDLPVFSHSLWEEYKAKVLQEHLFADAFRPRSPDDSPEAQIEQLEKALAQQEIALSRREKVRRHHQLHINS